LANLLLDAMKYDLLRFVSVGAPNGQPTRISRLVTVAYNLNQCQLFPSAFPNGVNVQVNRTNELYDGWNVNVDRLFFANGQRKLLLYLFQLRLINRNSSLPAGDPWKDETMSSVDSPATSTNTQPIELGDGFHCSDMLSFDAMDPTVYAVQQKGLSYMKTWLAQWTP
ncbi:hypothetical protein H0H92_001268, partial [Tricholoma furcatifolium]